MKTYSIVSPFPKPDQWKKNVDNLITPEFADRDARSLVEILSATTSIDADESCTQLAEEIMQYAYTHTMHFQRNFDNFCGRTEIADSNFRPEEKEETAELLN